MADVQTSELAAAVQLLRRLFRKADPVVRLEAREDELIVGGAREGSGIATGGQVQLWYKLATAAQLSWSARCSWRNLQEAVRLLKPTRCEMTAVVPTPEGVAFGTRELSRMDVELQYSGWGLNEPALFVEERGERVLLGNTEQLRFDRGELCAALLAVARSVSADETHPVLTGALWLVEGEWLQLVATDTYRLYTRHVRLQQPCPVKLKGIIPAAFMRLLCEAVAGMKKDAPETVQLWAKHDEGSLTKLQVELGAATLLVQPIDGQFVNYGKVIPTSWQHELTFQYDELLHTLEAGVAVAEADNYRGVFHAKGSSCRVTADVDRGCGTSREFEATLDLDSAVGNIEIAFNLWYVLDWMQTLRPGSVVKLGCNGPLDSGIWWGEQQAQSHSAPNAQYILMPMQLL